MYVLHHLALLFILSTLYSRGTCLALFARVYNSRFIGNIWSASEEGILGIGDACLCLECNDACVDVVEKILSSTVVEKCSDLAELIMSQSVTHACTVTR